MVSNQVRLGNGVLRLCQMLPVTSLCSYIGGLYALLYDATPPPSPLLQKWHGLLIHSYISSSIGANPYQPVTSCDFIGTSPE